MDHKSESDLIWNPENSFKENKQTCIFNELKIQNGFAFNSTLNLHSQKQYEITLSKTNKKFKS